MRNRSLYHKSLSGATVAAKMRKSQTMSGRAKKYAKLKRVTPERLDRDLPDYISGGDIWAMFKK